MWRVKTRLLRLLASTKPETIMQELFVQISTTIAFFEYYRLKLIMKFRDETIVGIQQLLSELL